jgi:hypothetical protein
LKWTCTKQWKCSYLPRHEGQIFYNFKIFLSIIKIVLDSMLYETLKWPQLAPFCISSKIIMACTLISLIYAPGSWIYNYLCNQCPSQLKLCAKSRSWWGVLEPTTLCDKVCQWLATGRWFSPVSSTNKTNRHDIAEILLKVALNTINHLTEWYRKDEKNV